MWLGVRKPTDAARITETVIATHQRHNLPLHVLAGPTSCRGWRVTPTPFIMEWADSFPVVLVSVVGVPAGLGSFLRGSTLAHLPWLSALASALHTPIISVMIDQVHVRFR